MDADIKDTLKAVMRNWTSGVGVVTSGFEGEHSGTTISSFASVSLDPPLVLFNLTGENATRFGDDRTKRQIRRFHAGL